VGIRNYQFYWFWDLLELLGRPKELRKGSLEELEEKAINKGKGKV